MKTLLVLFGSAMFVAAQPEMRNTITLSAGLAQNAGDNCCGETAPSIAVGYAYRLFSHLDLEVGIDTTLSLGSEARGANYDFKAEDRFIWIPFGLKGILPLRRDRLEVSIAAGGTYEKYSVGNPATSVGFLSRDGWGGYASAGASMALDRGRHFWLGASPRLFLVNTDQYAHDRWFVFNVGLELRF